VSVIQVQAPALLHSLLPSHGLEHAEGVREAGSEGGAAGGHYLPQGQGLAAHLPEVPLPIRRTDQGSPMHLIPAVTTEAGECAGLGVRERSAVVRVREDAQEEPGVWAGQQPGGSLDDQPQRSQPEAGQRECVPVRRAGAGAVRTQDHGLAPAQALRLRIHQPPMGARFQAGGRERHSRRSVR